MSSVLDDAAAGQGVEPQFQRVVSLPDETVVGYEALARWPGLGDVGPLDVFARARANGTLDALDHHCISQAAQAAMQGGATSGMLLLINVEPTTAALDPCAAAKVTAAAEACHLVFELTERELLTNPSALLRKVAALRAAGYSIALEALGAGRVGVAEAEEGQRGRVERSQLASGPGAVLLEAFLQRCRHGEVARTAGSLVQQREPTRAEVDGVQRHHVRERRGIRAEVVMRGV